MKTCRQTRLYCFGGKILKNKKEYSNALFTIFAIMEAVLELGVLIYTWKSYSLTAGVAVALITLIGNAYTPVAIFNVLYVQHKLDKAAFARLKLFLMADEDR